jgi:Ni/Co efflux regulator RcnB
METNNAAGDGYRKAAMIGFLVTVIAVGLGPAGHAAPLQNVPVGLEQVQYRDDNTYPGARDRNDNRYGDPRDFNRGDRIWRAGEFIPDALLDRRRIVNDWEERGLERPPRDHNWVRVGQQFLLVRFSDRRIARILSFY